MASLVTRSDISLTVIFPPFGPLDVEFACAPGDVLAVFNWGPEDRVVYVRAPGAVGARDLWTRQALPWFRDGAGLEVRPGSVSLLRLGRA